MDEDTKFKILRYFIIGYLPVSILVYYLNKNLEFLYYTVPISVIALLLVIYHKKARMSLSLLTGLATLAVMHLCGGNLHIAEVRLYDFWLIGGILKYDHVMHFIGLFLATIIVYNFIRPYLDEKILRKKSLLALLLILISCGLGATVELIEFVGVVLLNTGEMVGNYTNTLMDLVFNLLGAAFAALYLVLRDEKIDKV